MSRWSSARAPCGGRTWPSFAMRSACHHPRWPAGARDAGLASRRGGRPLGDERAARPLAGRVGPRAGGAASAHLRSRTRREVGILMYHRITDHCDDVSTPTWNVTPERFRRQLCGLLARGFRAWPLSKVIDHGRQGRPVPPRTFVVTFDDGYENVYRN